MDRKYSVELSREGGPHFGIEAELAREDNLGMARARTVAICPQRAQLNANFCASLLDATVDVGGSVDGASGAPMSLPPMRASALLIKPLAPQSRFLTC